jgi:Family of unknown function (DUF5677)
LVQQITKDLASNMLQRYKKEWKDYRPFDETTFGQFRDNLYVRWGKGLSALRLLLEISRDAGQAYHERLQRSKAKKNRHLRHVLVRLHIRACQVTSEIIALMENGYADGAMVRWRTLYEITTVATLITDGGDALAERYLEHDAIETKRALDEFLRCHAALGYRSPSKRNISEVTAAHDAAIARFGKGFGTPYGWAVGYLGSANSNPKFSHLEAAAGHASMRSYYKLASYNVHASPKGLSCRIGTIDDPSLLIAGATNAGLEEPGQKSAFSLSQTTSLLFSPPFKLDDLVHLHVLIFLRDAATENFLKAAEKLRRDEVALRKGARRINCTEK